jgi:hypothetical protein
MSITAYSPSWTSDPSVLASAIALAGAGIVWLLGRVYTAVARLVSR